jgi:hypothetical protein
MDELANHSILNTRKFNVFLRVDFTKLAGLVAEGIYRGRLNYKGVKGDFPQWVGTSLNQLPEKLNSRYIDFMLNLHLKTSINILL